MRVNRLFFFMLAATYLYAQETMSKSISAQEAPSQELKDQQKKADKKEIRKPRKIFKESPREEKLELEKKRKRKQEKVNKAVQAVPPTSLSPQKVVAMHDTAHAAAMQGDQTSTDAAFAAHQEVAKRLNVRASGGDDFPCAGSDADCIKFIGSVVGVAGVLTAGTIAALVKNSTIKSFLAQQTRYKATLIFTRLETYHMNVLRLNFRGITQDNINEYFQFINERYPATVNVILDGSLSDEGLISRVTAWRRKTIYSQIAKDYNKLNGGNISADEVQRNMEDKVEKLADSDLFDIQKFELPYYKFQYSFAVTSELKELGVTGENVSADTLGNYLKQEHMNNLVNVPAEKLKDDVRDWFIKNRATIDQIFALFSEKSVSEVIEILQNNGRLGNIQIPGDLRAILSETKWKQLSQDAKAALKNFVEQGNVKFLERFKFTDASKAFDNWAKNLFKIDQKRLIPGDQQAEEAKKYLFSIGYSDGEINEINVAIGRVFSMNDGLLMRLFSANEGESVYDFYVWFEKSGYVNKDIDKWVLEAFRDATFQPGFYTVNFLETVVGPEEFYKFIQGKGSKIYKIFTSDINAVKAYLEYVYQTGHSAVIPTAEDIKNKLLGIGYSPGGIKITVTQYLDLLKAKFSAVKLEGLPADIQKFLSNKKLVTLRSSETQALQNAILKNDINYLKRFKFTDQKSAVQALLKNMEGGELQSTSTQAIQQRLRQMGYADSEIYEGAVPSYIDNQLAFTRGARAISVYLKEHEGQAITRDMLRGQVPDNAMENQVFREQVYPRYVDEIWRTAPGAESLEVREIVAATRGMEVSEESELGNFVRILVELFF